MSRTRIALVLVLLLVAVAASPSAVAATRPAPIAPAGPIRLGYCGGDDWEPEMARDGAHVYVVITHYVGSTGCDPASGSPTAIYLQASSDGGSTFGAPHAVFTAPVAGVTYS